MDEEGLRTDDVFDGVEEILHPPDIEKIAALAEVKDSLAPGVQEERWWAEFAEMLLNRRYWRDPDPVVYMPEFDELAQRLRLRLSFRDEPAEVVVRNTRLLLVEFTLFLRPIFGEALIRVAIRMSSEGKLIPPLAEARKIAAEEEELIGGRI